MHVIMLRYYLLQKKEYAMADAAKRDVESEMMLHLGADGANTCNPSERNTEGAFELCWRWWERLCWRKYQACLMVRFDVYWSKIWETLTAALPSGHQQECPRTNKDHRTSGWIGDREVWFYGCYRSDSATWRTTCYTLFLTLIGQNFVNILN